MVVVTTEPIGGGALSQLAASATAPEEWYVRRPSGRVGWGTRADSLRREFQGRDWLGVLAPAVAAGGLARARLERCAAGRGIVVTTGQQPGLFGGPIYTWSKALSALALADALQAATGVPTAPVFWAATGDTDFEEARATRLAVRGGVETLELRQAPPVDTPMSRARLGNEVLDLLDRLGMASGAAVYTRALEVLGAAYQPSRTVGDAYVALLRSVLEPLGVAVLDASHPAVADAGRPVLLQALERASAVESAVVARERELAARGFVPQVSSVPGLTLVFRDVGGRRQRVPVRDARSVAASGAGDALSPNVLLRPVLERAILPTAAYVAGPGELAYFAQVSAVADALGATAPLALPRWSCTILEPRIERLLDRYGLRVDDLRDPHAPEGRMARAALPAPIASAIAEARRAVDSFAAALLGAEGRDGAQRLVPAPAVEGARRGLSHRLDRVERRYLAAVKRREAEVMTDLATARAALFPEGKRQERALNFMPLLARYGPELLAEMTRLASDHASDVAGLADRARGASLAGAR
jgi:bacillithiol biosynthesis cysteine-adding enzyme BshC